MKVIEKLAVKYLIRQSKKELKNYHFNPYTGAYITENYEKRHIDWKKRRPEIWVS